MPNSQAQYPSYYEFSSKKFIEPRLCDITTTGAAVIVNSIGSRANFRNSIAQSVLRACGDEIKDEVQRYRLIPSGGVIITHAGRLMKETLYLFHVVVTSIDAGYKTDPKLITPVTTRCVKLADLLVQPTIAIPPFGVGMGRGDSLEIVKKMLNTIIALLPFCKSLEKIIFATTNKDHFALFHNLALADIALAKHEQEIKDALPGFPPSMYGLVGDLLLRLEKARHAGDNPQNLLQQADGLVKVARELKEKLPSQSDSVAGTVQLVIATGGSIISNVTQQVEGTGV